MERSEPPSGSRPGSASSAAQPEVQLSLADFELGAEIHRGHRSIVQRATRRSDGRAFVLKTPKRAKVDREARRRLRHEQSMLGQAKGQGAVACLGLVTGPLGLGLMLEAPTGVTLRARVGHARLAVPDFLDLALQITTAVRALHATGVRHCDLRPENLITQAQGKGGCVLIDLGSASNVPAPSPEPRGLAAAELTYLAPEQTGRLGRDSDARADLYALGVVFYELLSGLPPLSADDPIDFVYTLIAQAPTPLAERVHGLPTPILEIVAKLLKKSPDQRYQSAGGLLVDLERCRRDWDLKGSIEPFEIARADHSAQLSFPDRIYGREDELAELASATEQASRGRLGAVAVVGAAGIGKSALVDSLRDWAVARRAWFATGKFEVEGSSGAYSALRSALRPLLRRILASPSAVLEQWRRTLEQSVGARADALIPIWPLLGKLVKAEAPSRELSPLEAQARQRAALADFLRALHRPESPLILCIEDLHWADPATLELLEGFLRAPDPGNPILVFSWRPKSISLGHPLHALLQRAGGQAVHVLELKAVSEQAICELIGDALNAKQGEVRALAAKVMQRTGGNPFFVRVFLRAAANADALSFDNQRMAWHWRLDALDAIEASEDIIPLLTEQLRARDAQSLELLGHLSVFANTVDLGLVALALGLPLEDLVRRVSVLSREGILRLRGEGWQFSGELEGGAASASLGAGHTGWGLFVAFPHDKVRAAAHELLGAEARAQLQWEIGQRLVDLGADTWGEEELFLCAEQLERGSSSDTSELRVGLSESSRARALAPLRRASIGAFKRAAFGRALVWAQAALALTPEDSQSEQRFSLHLTAAQAAVVLGESEARDAHLAAAQPIAPDAFGLVALDRVRIRAELAVGEHTAAVERTLKALARLDMATPRKPSSAQVAGLMARTMWMMRGGADKVRRLPVCEDTRVQAIVGLMSEAMIAAYLCEPNLAALFMLRPVTLTMKHGVTPHSPYGIASYAFLRAAQFHDIEGASHFAAAAREMVQRLDAKEVAAKVENLVVGFVEARNRPLIELLEGYALAVRAGLEGGDSTFAAQGAVNSATTLLAAGMPLEQSARAFLPHLALCRRLGQSRSVEWIALISQVTDNLRGLSEAPLELEGEHMQVDAWLAVHAAGGDKAAPTCLDFYRGQLAAWTGQPEAGLAAIEAAETSLSTLLGTLYVPLCHAYAGLIRVAAARDGSRPELLRRAHKSLRKLEPWVVPGPVNYDHLRHLLRAELADQQGDYASAEAAYDESIRLAKAMGVNHELAMALELAGRSWLRRGRGRVASSYLRDAQIRWREYGARANLERFDTLLREAADKGADELRSQGGDAEPTQAQGGVDNELVRRGAQALVGEIHLGNLLKQLLRLAMQASGATRSALVLRHGEGFVVAARAHAHDGEIEFDAVSHLADAPPAESLGPMLAVLNFVRRTRENVLTDDIREDPRFRAGFSNNSAPSVLAAPLVRGGEFVGVVMAQQDLVAGAFSARQLELVSTLAGQAAVSVANSLLYETLQSALARQEQLTQAYQRFVPAQFVDQLNKESILEVRLGDQMQGEFDILFADIRGFSSIAEELGPAATFKLINQYLAVMEPAIRRHGGYIKEFQGDGVLAVFSGSSDESLSGALAMHFALAQLNTLREADGLKRLRIGIGLHSGRLTFGAIGGVSRMASGVVGDAINAASRVEGLCKPYGAGLLFTGTTRERLEDAGAYQTRELDRVVVAGKRETLTIWEVLDGEPEPLRSGKLGSRDNYAKGLEAWRTAQFETAQRHFEAAHQACPQDRAAALFVERCKTQRKLPLPASWDGISKLSWK